MERTPATPFGKAKPRTHQGREVSLGVHCQHGLELSEARDGLAHQGVVETQDDRGHRVLHAGLRHRCWREQLAKKRNHSLCPIFSFTKWGNNRPDLPRSTLCARIPPAGSALWSPFVLNSFTPPPPPRAHSLCSASSQTSPVPGGLPTPSLFSPRLYLASYPSPPPDIYYLRA